MIARIDVQETREKKSLNTPGGEQLMQQLGSSGSGLPFFAFLDPGGKMIVNSMRPGEKGKKAENIGHPDTPKEVDWFLAMVHRAAPGMTASESAALEHWLRNQKAPAAR